MVVARAGLLVALVGCLSSPAGAQSTNNAGSAGAQFLKIGVGARAMGMGGAFGAIGGDPSTLAWNPAGIGPVDALALSVQHTSWVAGLDHNFIGVVVPITDEFNLAFHTIYLTSGDIEVTTIDQPEGTGETFDVSDISAGLTGSIRLTYQLTFAMTVKYITERIKDVDAGGMAFDVGAHYMTDFRSLTLGFSVGNLGFEQSFSGPSLEVKYQPPAPGEPLANSELQTLEFRLPLTFRASGAFDCFAMFGEPLEDHELLVAIDFAQCTDVPERLALGAEYAWMQTAFLRGGYLFNADELGWSLGAGVRVAPSDFVINVDYAASSLGRFGWGHRLGLAVEYR
jgi:hypothetical protein